MKPIKWRERNREVHRGNQMIWEKENKLLTSVFELFHAVVARCVVKSNQISTTTPHHDQTTHSNFAATNLILQICLQQ